MGTDAGIVSDRLVQLATSGLADWTDEEKLKVIQAQMGASDDVTRRKRDDWVNYTRLYLNQYRKQGNPESIGSKLLFTKFNETYANFATDEVAVEFLPRGPEDVEKVEALNRVRRYDWDQFDGATLWNARLWDRLFYGYDVLDLSGWDGEARVMKPQVVNPFYFFFDPLAESSASARWMGQICYLTVDEMLSHPEIDPDKAREVASGRSGASQVTTGEQYLKADEAKRVLLGTQYYQEPRTPTSYVQLLRWTMVVAGRRYRVWTNFQASLVLGWKEYEGLDYLVTPYYSLPRQLIGIGIPDLIEDDHRAKVKLSNYMLDAAKYDSIPRMLYKQDALVNANDLRSLEVNKHIPTVGDPNAVAAPFPKSNGVNSDTMGLMTYLDNEADGALAGRVARGAFTGSKKSATQISVEKAKQDMIMAAVGKTFISSEKQFWYEWLASYRRRGGGEKVLRILGKRGERVFQKIKVGDFLPKVDPDIEVVSKVVSEPQKVLARRDLGELIQPLAQAGGDVRASLRKLMYLMDLRKEDIDELLPQTPDEMRAERENDLLEDEKGVAVPIHENDDDRAHIAIHHRIDESPRRDRHIEAHILNYLRKGGHSDAGKPEEKKPEQGAAPAGAPSPQVGQMTTPQAERKAAGTDQAIQGILGGTKPSTTSAVK